MRAAVLFVLLLVLASPAFGECITVKIDVRRAEIVAVARYAGERTFVVESVLRTEGERPAKLVAPADWRSSPCAPPEPVAGEAYLVGRFETRLVFTAYEKSAAERALIERLPVVDARAVLDALERYGRGESSHHELEEWLVSAMVDAPREGSFTAELLDAAESLLDTIQAREPCHPDEAGATRADELPRAAEAIAALLPAVDTEAAFVARRLEGIVDPELRDSLEKEALDEWEETLDALRATIRSLDVKLQALPWCDPRKLAP
jgi:hypothetical protein